MTLLRELIYGDDVNAPVTSPLYNNIYTVLLTILYVKIGFEIASVLRWRMGKRRVPRIFLHLCLSTTILFWPLYDTCDWSWRLNCVVPCSMAARLFLKGALLKDSEDEDVQIITRSGSPFELMYGPLQLNLLLIFLGTNHFMTTEAAVLVAAVGLGDSVAPWIGSKFGRHVYRMPFGRSKTMEGSVCGLFLGTVIGCYFNLWFLGLPLLPLRILLAYAAIAAVTEGTAPRNMDNLTVPGVLYLTMERVVQWLPS